MSAQTQTSETLVGAPHVTLSYEKGKYNVSVKAPITVKVLDAWYDSDKNEARLELAITVNLGKAVVLKGVMWVETEGEDLISIYETAEKKAAEIIANNMATVMKAASNALWVTKRYNRNEIYSHEKYVIKKILYNVMDVDEIKVDE